MLRQQEIAIPAQAGIQCFRVSETEPRCLLFLRKPSQLLTVLVLLALYSPVFAQRSMGVQPTAPTQGSTGKRYALVIGNAHYTVGALTNPLNDAEDMATALRQSGFIVTLQKDLGLKAMKDVIRTFAGSIRAPDVALVYYSGHGMQYQGENYLIPVDAQLLAEPDIEVETVSMQWALKMVASTQSSMKLFIFDACRNNPFGRSFRSVDRGLAQITAPSGTFVAYATGPGGVASDNPAGRNGLYTGSLLRRILSPDQKLEDLFKTVRTDVRTASSGNQIPWESSSIEGNFYFVGGAMGTATPVSAQKTTTPAPRQNSELSIVIIAPRSSTTVTQPDVTVEGQITSSSRLSQYQILLNERIVYEQSQFSDQDHPRPSVYSFHRAIKLSQSSNMIQVLATTTDGEETSEIALVTFRPPADTTPPRIVILEPTVTRSVAVVSAAPQIAVRGQAIDESGIASVTVNGISATLATSGEFFATVPLTMGDNTLRIVATDTRSNTAQEVFSVVREQASKPPISTTPPKLPAPAIPNRKGSHYALLFATDQYDEWNRLVNPIKDAKTIATELASNYGFRQEVVENPTQNDILSKLRTYAEKRYQEDDQLLIFFAGHGKFDETLKEGFVVTKDSKRDEENNMTYLAHSRLRQIVENIPSKHILLVMDVCFGGTFDPLIASAAGPRGDEYAEVSTPEMVTRKLRYKTRLCFTSGGKEYVPDGTPGQHSPFARKFLEALRSFGGSDGILTSAESWTFLEKVKPEPRRLEFGSNDPGSDFIFIMR